MKKIFIRLGVLSVIFLSGAILLGNVSKPEGELPPIQVKAEYLPQLCVELPPIQVHKICEIYYI